MGKGEGKRLEGRDQRSEVRKEDDSRLDDSLKTKGRLSHTSAFARPTARQVRLRQAYGATGPPSHKATADRECAENAGGKSNHR